MAAPSKNYAELAASVVDIHEANYAAFYTPFGAAANQPAPAVIRDAVLDASNSYPKVFVKVTDTVNGVRVSCLVRPTRFRAPLGIISPHTGHYHCLLGDISNHGLPTVIIWPADAFARSAANITIATVAELEPTLCCKPYPSMRQPIPTPKWDPVV